MAYQKGTEKKSRCEIGRKQSQRWSSSSPSKPKMYLLLLLLQDKQKSKKEVIMVDPLEAKRLAGKQMEEIKGREKQQRRREIEAINGAWAVIGLLIGLVIEEQTGKGILAQLTDYVSAVVHLFIPPSQNLPQ